MEEKVLPRLSIMYEYQQKWICFFPLLSLSLTTSLLLQKETAKEESSSWILAAFFVLPIANDVLIETIPNFQ